MAINLKNYNSLLQTKQWSQFKSSFGWETLRLGNLYILKKKIALGRSVLYIPEIPQSLLEELDFNKLKELGKKHNAVFIKIEPIISVQEKKFLNLLYRNGFIKSFEDLQPTNRQMVDISKDEEKILTGMRPKGRYNIRLAQRKGVKIKAGVGDREIRIFYKLFVETSKREKFTPRAKIYFQKMVSMLEKQKWGKIFIAYSGHTPLAAIIAGFYENTATYLYGASSDQMRNLMAPYLLHWSVIKQAKTKKCTIYDLLAITPKGKSRHKYAGITEFKEKFGGARVDLLGSFDLILSPVLYSTYRVIERYRRGL